MPFVVDIVPCFTWLGFSLEKLQHLMKCVIDSLWVFKHIIVSCLLESLCTGFPEVTSVVILHVSKQQGYYVCMDKEEDKISVSKAVMMGCPFDLQRLTATNSCLLGTTKKQ